MSFKFNPFTGTFDVVSDFALADVDRLTSTNATLALTDDATNATAALGGVGGHLTFTNPNTDKSIIFNVDRGGTQIDFVKLDGAYPSIDINPAGTPSLGGSSPGFLAFRGTWSGAGTVPIMTFSPSISTPGATPLNAVLFNSDPVFGGKVGTAYFIDFKPNVSAGTQALTVVGFYYRPVSYPVGYNVTTTGWLDAPAKLFFSPYTAATWTMTGVGLGSAAYSFVSGGVINDTHLSMTGGGAAAGGTVNQWGIKMTGYGSLAGAYAVLCDGGPWALKADNLHLRFGGGEDAYLYYNGTNFIVDPDYVGSGRVYIGATGDDDMLLNTIEIDGNLDHDGSGAGFFGTAPVAKQTGCAVPTDLATCITAITALRTALNNYGLTTVV